jgi:O-antigen ligase
VTVETVGVLIVASPIVMNPLGYDQYQLPRLVAQVALVLIGIGAVFVAGLRLARPLVPLTVFLGILAVSALLSAAPNVALVGTDSRRFGLLGWTLLAGSFLVGLGLESPVSRRRLLHSICWVSVPIGLYALAQRLGLDPFDWRAAALIRPVSTVGNASFLGGFMALALVVTVGILLLDDARAWLWVISALDLVVLMLSGARGAWIGALVGLVAVLFRSFRSGAKSAVIRVAVGGVLVVLVMLVTVPGVALRAATLGSVTEGTAGGRIALATVGFDAIKAHPFLGWGPDLSRPAIERNLTSNFEARYGDSRIEDRVHNTLLDITVWSGLIGLATFLWFAASFVRSSRPRWGEPTAWITLMGVLAFAVHLLFNFPVPDLDAVVWMLMGSVVASTRRLPPAPVGLAIPAVALGGLLMLPMAADALNADRHLRIGVDQENGGELKVAGRSYLAAARAAGGSRYHEVLSRYSMRTGEAMVGVQAARAVVRADPSDPYGTELLASALDAAAQQADQPQLAVEAEGLLRAAIAAAPNDGSLFVELGVSLSTQHRWDEAVQVLQRAVLILPRSASPVRDLGLLELLRGNRDAAEQLLKGALTIDPSDEKTKAALEQLNRGA